MYASDRARSSLLEALTEWAVDLHTRGGDFSQDALNAAGRAAVMAEHSGLSFSDAFEAGRTAYFEHLRTAVDTRSPSS